MKNKHFHSILTFFTLLALCLIWQPFAHAKGLHELFVHQKKKSFYAGSIVISNPAKSLRKVFKLSKTLYPQFSIIAAFGHQHLIKKIQSTPEARKGFQKYLPELLKYNTAQLLQKFPDVAAKYGFNLNAPIAHIIGFHNAKPLHFLTLSVFPERLERWLEIARKVQDPKIPIPKFYPSYGNVRILFLKVKGIQIPAGLLLGQRLYLSLDRFMYKNPKSSNIDNITAFYHHMIKQKIDPLAETIQHAAVYNPAELHNYDLVASTCKGIMYFKGASPSKQFLRGLGGVAKIQKGFFFQSRFDFKGPALSFLKLFTPKNAPADWISSTPSSTGWYARTHLNPLAIREVIKSLQNIGIIKPSMYQKGMLGVFMAVLQIKTPRIDMPSLLKSFTGQFASGMLWDSKTVSQATVLRRNVGKKLFVGNLRGIFMQIGFHNNTEANNFTATIKKLYDFTKKRFPKAAKIFKVSEVTLGQSNHLKIETRFSSSFYLLAHKEHVLFAGHKDTRDSFLKTWNGSIPSLAKVQPQVGKGFMQKGNQALLQTRMLLDSVNIMAPMNKRMIAINILQRLQHIMTRTQVVGTQWRESFSIPIGDKNHSLTPKQPLGVQKKPFGAPLHQVATVIIGVPAAFALSISVLSTIAIPAFLTYIKKSKAQEARINLRKLKYKLYNYYSLELSKTPHSEKQFPCAGKGWICSPSAKPCHKGKAKYNANPLHWKNSCWSKIKFSIQRPHYYQYCYKSKGIGAKAEAQIEAHGDLDCDGSLSTFRISLRMVNGKMKSSRMAIKKELE